MKKKIMIGSVVLAVCTLALVFSSSEQAPTGPSKCQQIKNQISKAPSVVAADALLKELQTNNCIKGN